MRYEQSEKKSERDGAASRIPGTCVYVRNCAYYTVYETHYSRSCACLYKNKIRLCNCVRESDTLLRSATCLGRYHGIRDKIKTDSSLLYARDHTTYGATVSRIGVKSACLANAFEQA